jgi:hypothetical protein
MGILMHISGKTLLDKVRSEDVSRSCKVEDTNEWIHQRKIEWNERINRIEDNRLVVLHTKLQETSHPYTGEAHDGQERDDATI